MIEEKEEKIGLFQEMTNDFKAVAFDLKNITTRVQGFFSDNEEEAEEEEEDLFAVNYNIQLDQDKYNELRKTFEERRNSRTKRIEFRKIKEEREAADERLRKEQANLSFVDKNIAEVAEETSEEINKIDTPAVTEVTEEIAETADSVNIAEDVNENIVAEVAEGIIPEIAEEELVDRIYKLDKYYILPSLDFLKTFDEKLDLDNENIPERKKCLQDVLDSFTIDATVFDAIVGPRVTLFKVNPAVSVKVDDISRIGQNIAMEMSATSLRIMAPVPGKNYVGIEVPNKNAEIIGIKTLFESEEWKTNKDDIPLILGKDITGNNIITDLAKAPHLLIAGATGSGKSVCLNTIILSLLYKFNPEDLRLILVDPKVVEFSMYNSIPHLTVPVLTDPDKVPMALRWAVNEMEKRYRMLADVKVRNLESFNERDTSEDEYNKDGELIPKKLPRIVIIIDELADLMMTSQAEVETSLARLAQKSRAVGIHAIIATQRPSINVITGVIKANFPTRIAFKVTNLFDSRTILDSKGAETLLGYGDMFYKSPTDSLLRRIQGPFVSDDEIVNITDYISENSEQHFNMGMFVEEKVEEEKEIEISDEDLEGKDEIELAIEIICESRKASTSYLQRRLKIGYNKAAGIMDELEDRGIIGPQIGSAPREILINC